MYTTLNHLSKPIGLHKHYYYVIKQLIFIIDSEVAKMSKEYQMQWHVIDMEIGIHAHRYGKSQDYGPEMQEYAK